ncbi:nitroreductase family deazaflavin-dependent oxidoreductase [Gordonia sp. TBRC 11910]|uniref:Nitroreductase family deazaflavin-dependent oxidoreductase n=1 Tax=Gordonia asplenii TaxID=2725283 RepID=A0A848L9C9_9ACTN|nr:nitroreductase/quinone reductase family protein [Gordonia asplenii]NMO04188.1 nitroreductase family deazaflavin-dependent oxidoreductase [Gordonia asplenii]
MTTGHYHSASSPVERGFNSAVRWLADHGVNLAGAQALTVYGRKTGNPQRIPVNPISFDGREYLVSPRGNTQWARNARVNTTAELKRGRKQRQVALTEVSDADVKTAVISDYLRRWGWEVGRLLPDGLAPDSDEATLRAHLDDLPVFTVTTMAG